MSEQSFRSRSSTSSNVDSETNLIPKEKYRTNRTDSNQLCIIESPELDNSFYKEDTILKETDVFSIMKYLEPSELKEEIVITTKKKLCFF